MATINKTHTFIKYTGSSVLNISGLSWLQGQVQRIWSPSSTGSSMASAGYNASNSWGGTLTQFTPGHDGYWIHAKTTGWDLPSYLVKIAETDTAPTQNTAPTAIGVMQPISQRMADGVYTLDLTAFFHDAEGNPLTFSAALEPANTTYGTVAVQGNQLRFTPVSVGTGAAIRVTASDGILSVSRTVSVTVPEATAEPAPVYSGAVTIDDAANTAAFPYHSLSSNFADYQYTLNEGGSFTTCNGNPQFIGNLNVARVGFRLKAAGTRPASNILYSTVGLTTGLTYEPIKDGSAIDPYAVPGLIVDVDPDQPVYSDQAGTQPSTTDGALVRKMTNNAPGGVAVEEWNSEPAPILRLGRANGHNVLEFDGTKGLNIGATILDQQHTVFYVLKKTENVAYGVLLNGIGNGTQAQGFDDTGDSIAFHSTGNSAKESNLQVANGSYNIISSRGSGAFKGGLSAYPSANIFYNVNGYDADSVLGIDSLIVGDTYSRFGETRSNSNGFKGELVRMLVYNRILTRQETRRIGKHLSAKYAVVVQDDTQGFVLEPSQMMVMIDLKGAPVASQVAGTQRDFIEAPAAYNEDGQYYCYYSGWNPERTRCTLWCNYGSAPDNLPNTVEVLTNIGAPAWSSAYVHGCRMHKFGNKYYLYFFGSMQASFEGEPASIGVAVGDTPIGPFTFHPDALIVPVHGTWEQAIIYRPWVVFNEIDNLYYLFYNAKGITRVDEHIGFATSASPTGPFVKYANNPVVYKTGQPREHWGDSRIGDPVIYPYHGGWLMLYFGANDDDGSNPQYGFATSTDLVNWTVYPNNPGSVLARGGTFRPALFLNEVNQRWEAYADNMGNIYHVVADKQT